MLTIDVHHHILPDFFWRETNKQDGPVGGIAPPPWSKESAQDVIWINSHGGQRQYPI
jgi:hypothetical protein